MIWLQVISPNKNSILIKTRSQDPGLSRKKSDQKNSLWKNFTPKLVNPLNINTQKPFVVYPRRLSKTKYQITPHET